MTSNAHKTNLVLIGFMGSGKTTVARELSRLISMPWLDTDVEIEKAAQMPVSEIFANHGEAYFRRLEHEICQKISVLHHTIIATGGGMVLDIRNISALRQSSIFFYLQASPAKIYENIGADNTRPLLNTGDRPGVIENLLAQRHPLYQQTADYTICTEAFGTIDITLKIAEIAKAILNLRPE
jgi:shikimate kinase